MSVKASTSSNGPVASIIRRTVLRLSRRELEAELETLNAIISPEIILAYFHVARIPIVSWVLSEIACKDKASVGLNQSCMDESSAKYNTAVKEAIFAASLDLSPPWFLSSWVLRHVNYLGLWHRIGKPDEYEGKLAETLGKTISYSLYIALLEGLSDAALHVTRGRYEYAELVAAYIYWDVINPLYEYISLVSRRDSFLSFLENLLGSLREETSKTYTALLRQVLSGSRTGRIEAGLRTRILVQRMAMAAIRESMVRISRIMLEEENTR